MTSQIDVVLLHTGMEQQHKHLLHIGEHHHHYPDVTGGPPPPSLSADATTLVIFFLLCLAIGMGIKLVIVLLRLRRYVSVTVQLYQNPLVFWKIVWESTICEKSFQNTKRYLLKSNFSFYPIHTFFSGRETNFTTLKENILQRLEYFVVNYVLQYY